MAGALLAKNPCDRRAGPSLPFPPKADIAAPPEQGRYPSYVSRFGEFERIFNVDALAHGAPDLDLSA